MGYSNNSHTIKVMAALIVLALMISFNPLFGQKDQITSYYNEGKAAANSNAQVNGWKVIGGGAASGALLGPIGWGLGYLIFVNLEPAVPDHYISNLDIIQKTQFELGYLDAMKEHRKLLFNFGSCIGNVIFVSLVQSVWSQK